MLGDIAFYYVCSRAGATHSISSKRFRQNLEAPCISCSKIFMRPFLLSSCLHKFYRVSEREYIKALEMYMGSDICSQGLTFRWVHIQNISFKISIGTNEIVREK